MQAPVPCPQRNLTAFYCYLCLPVDSGQYASVIERDDFCHFRPGIVTARTAPQSDPPNGTGRVWDVQRFQAAGKKHEFAQPARSLVPGKSA